MAFKSRSKRLTRGGKQRLKATQEPIGFGAVRLQIDELHDGHKTLFRHMLRRHKVVAIIVGQTGNRVGSEENALTFEMVKVMIEQAFPKRKHRMVILPLEDNPISHFHWAQDLDDLLRKTFPGRTFIGYGGRKSFLNEYVGVGEFDTERVPDVSGVSGTERRAAIKFPHTKDARAALLWYHRNRPKLMFSTGDLAIYDKKKDRILLVGKKKWRGMLGFMGGHADKLDQGAQHHCTRTQRGNPGYHHRAARVHRQQFDPRPAHAQHPRRLHDQLLRRPLHSGHAEG